MERFLKRHQRRVTGILTGFDRIVFRGTPTSIAYLVAMTIWLFSRGVLFKQFGEFANKLSQRIKDHAEAYALRQERPFRYLSSSREKKDHLARAIQRGDQIQEGLICILSCVESCRSYSLRRDRQRKQLELINSQRKCLHLYFYYMDRDLGFMHVRLQTWFPFTIQVCCNGREWLARQMDRAGIGYQRRENCFTRIGDLKRAQQIMDQFHQRRWAGILSAMARRINPLLNNRLGLSLRSYYWTVWQSEYATDVMFRSADSLAQIYPRLIRHALEQFRTPDVLRFLGRHPHGDFQGEVKTHWSQRLEGVRIKHWVEENSIKMYDKQGSVLRIETTINNPKRFRVRRRMTLHGQPWERFMPMRKGIADFGRRVQASRAANGRYLEALAVVETTTSCGQLLDPLSQPVQDGERRYRPLRPISPQDSQLFAILQRAEFLLHGFCNRDLRKFLLQPSGSITRQLALLRAHHLIYRLLGTHRYRITKKGQHVMTTALCIRQCSLQALAA